MIHNAVRAAKASAHTDDCEKFYSDRIKYSSDHTRFYDGFENNPGRDLYIDPRNEPHFSLSLNTSLEELFEQDDSKKICVHNFASFTSPGGGFIRGALAQEEDLCHHSFLYNVLERKQDFYDENKHHMNHGLYACRGLYTDMIWFDDGNDYHDYAKADILTVAAPNWNEAKFDGVKPLVNESAFAGRISFIRDILEVEKPDIFITGAFGCGVFGQDPTFCCKTMLQEFKHSSIPEIIFAIPAGPNYDAFYSVMF